MASEDQLRFSADLPEHLSSSPDTNAPLVRVCDVAIQSAHGETASAKGEGLVGLPYLEGTQFVEPPAVDLSRRLSIVKLEQELAERVFQACTPRGHYFVPHRQFGQSYTFTLDVERSAWEADIFAWDPDHILRDALAMSRYIHDNGHTAQFSARIADYEDGSQRISWAAAEVGQRVYRLRETPDWVTYEHAEELGALLAAYWSVDGLPKRVGRAIWMAEYCTKLAWLDVVVPLLVVALEALINASHERVARQFRERVPAITAEAGVPGIDEDTCRWIYKARSRWVHGSHIALISPDPEDDEPSGPASSDEEEVMRRVALIQDGLRAVLRKCIEDRAFREHFQDDATVAARWPVSAD